MYPNLCAELARINKVKRDLAPLLNVRAATIYDKLNGNAPLYMSEAIKIRNELFPNLSIDYLFTECEGDVTKVKYSSGY